MRVEGQNSTLHGTTSQQVLDGRGEVLGIFVASSTAGTIKLYDALDQNGDVLVGIFTAQPGTWYPLPFTLGIGLYIEVGGTIDYTISFGR